MRQVQHRLSQSFTVINCTTDSNPHAWNNLSNLLIAGEPLTKLIKTQTTTTEKQRTWIPMDNPHKVRNPQFRPAIRSGIRYPFRDPFRCCTRAIGSKAVDDVVAMEWIGICTRVIEKFHWIWADQCHLFHLRPLIFMGGKQRMEGCIGRDSSRLGAHSPWFRMIHNNSWISECLNMTSLLLIKYNEEEVLY